MQYEFCRLEKLLGMVGQECKRRRLDEDGRQEARLIAWRYWHKHDGYVSGRHVARFAALEVSRNKGDRRRRDPVRAAMRSDEQQLRRLGSQYARLDHVREIAARDHVDVMLAMAMPRDAVVAHALAAADGRRAAAARLLRTGERQIREACQRLAVIAADVAE